MIKKIIFIAISCVILVVPFQVLRAQRLPINISVFAREGCVHCQIEEEFLDQLSKEMPNIAVSYYDIAEPKNRDLFEQITSRYSLVKGTPITLVGGRFIEGFGTAETTGAIIRDILAAGAGENKKFEDMLNIAPSTETQPQKINGFVVKLPVINRSIDTRDFSLGALSVVLGFIDGFNPCAMWVLVMFLIILAQLQSRKKMLQCAGLFILAEAIMYYGILNVWLTTWDFVGLNRVVTPLVGLLALGSGMYFIYKFATYKQVCVVASQEQRKKISQRVKELAENPLTIGAALGILGLAFSVNVFEFACSIGIPQTFTKVLDINSLSWLGRQWYMFLYILMYMIDDVIVFGLALYGLDKIGLTHKYSKYSTLVGGLLMLILGVMMLVKPGLLIF